MPCILRKLNPHTLRARLLLWYASVFALSAGALVLFVYLLVQRQFMTDATIFLLDETEESSAHIRRRHPDMAALKRWFKEEMNEKYFRPYCRVFDTTPGKTLVTLADKSVRLPVDPQRLRQAYAGQSNIDVARSIGPPVRSYLLHTFPIDTPNGRLVAQYGVELDRVEGNLDILRTYSLLSIPVILAFATAGGAFLSGRSLKPMADVVNRLRFIRSLDLSRRLPPQRVQDELGMLIGAINEMLAEIEAAFGRIKSYTSDVAHELRTPLAIVLCEVEVALRRPRTPDEYREILSSVLERGQALSAMVDNMLFLARTDSTDPMSRRDPVDLVRLLHEVGESFQIVAEDKGVGLEVSHPARLTVPGNHGWLKILFANLLDNAIKYTPGGGRVSVSAEVDGGRAVVSVEDTGVGVPAADLPKIFDRLYRTDKSRSRLTGGFGLGLSIAKRVVERHDGEISARSELGKGSVFQVRLPLASRGEPRA